MSMYSQILKDKRAKQQSSTAVDDKQLDTKIRDVKGTLSEEEAARQFNVSVEEVRRIWSNT